MSKNPSDTSGRKSTSGYISYSCGPTNWKSKLQSIPATSSAQAEFVAMYESAKDLLYQILLFREIGIKLVRVPLFCDNTTTIKQMMETTSSKSNKHMEIRYAWLQHYAHREWIVQPFNIASGNNLADMRWQKCSRCVEREKGLVVQIISTSFASTCSQVQFSNTSTKGYAMGWLEESRWTRMKHIWRKLKRKNSKHTRSHDSWSLRGRVRIFHHWVYEYSLLEYDMRWVITQHRRSPWS